MRLVFKLQQRASDSYIWSYKTVCIQCNFWITFIRKHEMNEHVMEKQSSDGTDRHSITGLHHWMKNPDFWKSEKVNKTKTKLSLVVFSKTTYVFTQRETRGEWLLLLCWSLRWFFLCNKPQLQNCHIPTDVNPDLNKLFTFSFVSTVCMNILRMFWLILYKYFWTWTKISAGIITLTQEWMFAQLNCGFSLKMWWGGKRKKEHKLETKKTENANFCIWC